MINLRQEAYKLFETEALNRINGKFGNINKGRTVNEKYVENSRLCANNAMFQRFVTNTIIVNYKVNRVLAKATYKSAYLFFKEHRPDLTVNLETN